MRLQPTAFVIALCLSGLAQAGTPFQQAADGFAALAQPAPEGARVYFIQPADGAHVRSPVRVVFGLTGGMGVAPAGVNQEKTGHHHLLVNEPVVDLRLPLPATEQILHFGGGQTEAQIELPPGRHRLQLLLGDWKHQPHQPPVMSDLITITVE